MKELIFSIENIFNNHNQKGCLSQYGVIGYHIPAYQRGYKWSSDEYGAVSVLLNDIYNAYNKDQNNEYYLQYITLKKIPVDQHHYLEVIDGQQRLTTLSILLSVFKLFNEDNIAKNKLDYAIRDDFFESHVYNEINLKKLTETSWNELIKENDEFNKQDVFYFYEAINKCYSFLQSIFEDGEIKEIYNYVLKQVKLIVNSVEARVKSETIFKNLNSNKVPLSEVELVKGLLVTKVAREDETLTFREISEIRMNLGRNWDEIQKWCNTPTINHFYLNNNGFNTLLTLVAIHLDNNKFKLTQSTNNPLFNFYNEFGQPTKVYKTLIEVKNILNGWFKDKEIFNLIGFCRFSKKSNQNNIVFLDSFLKKNRTAILEELKTHQKSILKFDKEVKNLDYSDDSDKKLMHDIFLYLSVFTKGIDTKFNYYDFTENKWTIEHIYPQSPFGKEQILTASQKEELIKLIDGKYEEKDVIVDLINQDFRTDEEIEKIHEALKNHSPINQIGNLCLLSQSNNSSVGNTFFDIKRNSVLEFIQRGNFVPKHTFDVFSKMIKGLSKSEISSWKKVDMLKHLVYIKKELETI